MNTDENRILLYLLPSPKGRRRAGNHPKNAAKGFCIALLAVASLAIQNLARADDTRHVLASAQPAAVDGTRKRADFKGENTSLAARHTANWVIDSGDNLGMPFMIVDKVQARVLLFDARGQLSGAASALLGLAVGDDSVPGIGNRKLSSIRPEERTTPAGRFVASLGRNLKGKDILWVDYENAISLHRVVTSNAKERRAERLASRLTHDKRISFGCINVPVEFFDRVVSPAFRSTSGVVYVLPETRENHRVFAGYYAVD